MSVAKITKEMRRLSKSFKAEYAKADAIRVFGE